MADAVLIVDQASGGTTIQDAGRPGWLRFGVPAGGAVDSLSLAIANGLVGNPVPCAAIEIGFDGAAFRVAGTSILAAVMGGDASLQVDRPFADGSWHTHASIPAGQSARIPDGARVTVTRPLAGARTMLAIAGGIVVPEVLGSRSTHQGAGIGGLAGRALAPGDHLPLNPPRRLMAPCRLPRLDWPKPVERIRLMPGPQINHFTPAMADQLTRTVWRVSSQADRMGMRLDGPALGHNRLGADIVSDGIPLGSVQVPGDGTPIILLADRQPTGGYPKIGVVIAADLPHLGQLRPGDPLRFAWVDPDTAEAAARRQSAWLNGLAGLLVPIEEDVGKRAERLRSRPLLDGIVERPAEAVEERPFASDDDPPGVPGP